MKSDASFLIKPVSGSCELSCSYCFYADELRQRKVKQRGLMSFDTLGLLVERALSEVKSAAAFVFQGGEPLLAGLDFYRELLDFQKKYNHRGIRIQNSIQTNGIAIDEEWARFLHDHRFLVGLSLDGYQKAHDANRCFPDGSGSFDAVMRSVSLMDRFQVDYNILCVVTAQNARKIRGIYSFFKEKGFLWQQYIPCLDPFGQPKGSLPYSLTPERYGRFLMDLFDLWYADRIAGKKVYIRSFENWLAMLKGCRPESCAMAGLCAPQWVIEADGTVYPCDFYALDRWELGSIRDLSFSELERKRQALGFVASSASVPDECQSCRWYPLCRNGCRRERAVLSDGITAGKNVYCESYRDFFSYVFPRLSEMAKNL